MSLVAGAENEMKMFPLCLAAHLLAQIWPPQLECSLTSSIFHYSLTVSAASAAAVAAVGVQWLFSRPLRLTSASWDTFLHPPSLVWRETAQLIRSETLLLLLLLAAAADAAA